jgi:uncharacterized protein
MDTTPPADVSRPGTNGRDRDRNAAGRARNARPRDGLGRPLPYGSPGVPTTDETLLLSPAEALEEAQRLLDAGRPFHAHEVLEATWKSAPDDEREFWRGMAQLAVGLTHARRGNRVGAARLLTRAADRIEPYATLAPHGVPVAELAVWARTLADRIGREDADVPENALTPRLTR